MKALVLVFLLQGYNATKEDNLPHWVNQYLWSIQQFRKKSEDIYVHPQPRLSTLLRLGRGNCVSYSKLGCSIAWMHELCTEAYTLQDKQDGGLHRVLVVYDRGTRWLIDNWNIRIIDRKFGDMWDGLYRIKRRWHITKFDDEDKM